MIKVYLANRPPLAEYLSTDVMDHLPVGEIKRIADDTGNHWRKIFNVYAKLIYCLAELTNDPLLLRYSSWQEYRDQALLQQGSETELHFERPLIEKSEFPSPLCVKAEEGMIIHIVMGKAFSERILEATTIEWLDKDFAINREQSIIVCPYFDYRQLSNIKIQTLAELIQSLQGQSCHEKNVEESM